jgi:hypothetical protein
MLVHHILFDHDLQPQPIFVRPVAKTVSNQGSELAVASDRSVSVHFVKEKNIVHGSLTLLLASFVENFEEVGTEGRIGNRGGQETADRFVKASRVANVVLEEDRNILDLQLTVFQDRVEQSQQSV